MTKQDKPTMKIEEIAELMHNTYEDKAREFGWSTQEKTRVPFNDLPESNKQTMLAVAEVVISTIRREAVGGITEQDMTDTIEAIDTIVNNDWGFDISLKLANKKEFTQEEAVQMGERIMDIYVLVHGFDTQCCKSSKAKLIQKLLSYKKVTNE